MQTKQHYKMYKDGKHWVFAAITVAALGWGTMVGEETLAHADTTPTSAASSQIESSANQTTAKEVSLGSSAVAQNASATPEVNDQNSAESGKAAAGNEQPEQTEPSTDVESDQKLANAADTESTTGDAPSTATEAVTDATATDKAASSVEKTVTPATDTVESSSKNEQTAPVSASENNQRANAQPGIAAAALPADGSQLAQPQSAAIPVNALAAPVTVKAALPATDQSNFDFTFNADGTAILTGLSGKTLESTVVIPTTVTNGGATYNVTAIGDSAFFNQPKLTQNVTTLVIGNGIKSIGDYAFGYLNNIQVVDLSENHTLTTIGNGAFVSSGLTSLVLPATVQVIGDGAFEFNNNLATVDFSQATQLASIGQLAFANDSQLTTLNIPILTTMGTAAFAGNTNLTTVTLGDGVRQIGDYAFSGYQSGDIYFSPDTALTTVNFGEGLQTIGDYAFTYDGGISTLNLPASLTSIGDFAFGAMTAKDAAGNTTSGLTTLNFAPSSQLKTIGNSAFIYDTLLDHVNLPASLETIGSQAFLANTSLSSIKLPASLISVGTNAFTYDAKLATLDTSEATALMTIQTGAFEYAGLTGKLVLPANLMTIGDLAFAGNHFESLQTNANLTTIGASAFAYNALGGSLDLTSAALTSLGNEAFYGNQLSGVQVAPTTVIGTNAFAYNRLSQLSAGAGNPSLALNQMVTIFTSKNELNSIDDLFETKIGSVGNDQLRLTNLTNGVTYANGQFTIPNGVDDFTFSWTLKDGTGITYSGNYQVVLNDPHIQVANSTVWYGDNWTPTDNIVSATMTDGTSIPESDWANFTVTITDSDGRPVMDAAGQAITADTMTQTPGTYNVIYTYQGESATATITVKKRQASYQLTGSSTVTYNGQTPDVSGAGYTVTFSNGFVYTLKDGDLVVVPNAGTTSTSNAGTYTVAIDDAAIDRVLAETPAGNYFDWEDLGTTATITIDPAVLTVAVPATEKAAGTVDPDFAFTTSVGDQPVGDSGLTTANITRQKGETAGTYLYVINPQGLSGNYTLAATTLTTGLTINPVTPTLTASDYTMTVNGPTPTVSDFKGQATDTNALPVALSEIDLNLGNADLTKAGDYPVTLTYGGMTQTVMLHVVAATTGGGGNPVDPDMPDVTDPVAPTDPKKPTQPTTPTVPDESTTHQEISDQGVRRHGAGATLNIQARKQAQRTLKRYHRGIQATIQDSPATLKHGGNGAVIVPTTAKSKSTRVASQTANKSVKATALPQTSEASESWWVAWGILIGSLGLAELRKRRHQ